MDKLKLITKLLTVLPVLASDISSATADKFVSAREIFKTVKDFLTSTGLGTKVAIKVGDGSDEITLLELVDGLEKFLDTIIGVDRLGFEITNDSFKYVIRKTPVKG